MSRSNTHVTFVTSLEHREETRLPVQERRLDVSSPRLDGAKLLLSSSIPTSFRLDDSSLRNEVPTRRLDVFPLRLDASRRALVRTVVPSRGSDAPSPQNVSPSRKFCLRFTDNLKTSSRDSKTSSLVLEEPSSRFEPRREDFAK
jgi:hypothetical protein